LLLHLELEILRSCSSLAAALEGTTTLVVVVLEDLFGFQKQLDIQFPLEQFH
jgi:hypothetical protein